MTEVEIKLAPATQGQADAVFADGEIAPFLGREQLINMHTRYFDTAGGTLAAHGFALRLRQEDDAFVCTFKACSVPGGPRLEIEAPAQSLRDGIAAILTSGELPPEAAEILRGGGFEEICAVRFVRRTALCSREGVAFWLCFDSGSCIRGPYSGAIAEIELELACGTPAQLEAVAQGLCLRHGLEISTISKLARAMALVTGGEGE